MGLPSVGGQRITACDVRRREPAAGDAADEEVTQVATVYVWPAARIVLLLGNPDLQATRLRIVGADRCVAPALALQRNPAAMRAELLERARRGPRIRPSDNRLPALWPLDPFPAPAFGRVEVAHHRELRLGLEALVALRRPARDLPLPPGAAELIRVLDLDVDAALLLLQIPPDQLQGACRRVDVPAIQVRSENEIGIVRESGGRRVARQAVLAPGEVGLE